MDRIYLDHAATTPMLPAARAAVADATARWANPSSPHAEGRAARTALEDARERIKAALGWRHDLLFTSGASEALALALGRQRPPRPVLVGATEHLAVLRAVPHDTPAIPVGAGGLIDPPAFGELLRATPAPLVAVQHANPETGILQPIAELVETVDAAGGVMLVDCAQTAGKLPLPQADLLAVSAHKLGGPPGIGALLVRDLSVLEPIGRSAQERGYRAGTENLPAALGFAAALEGVHDRAPPGWLQAQIEWRVFLDNVVENLGGEVVGGHLLLGLKRTPTIASYRLPGISARAALVRLDLAGFAVSAGSACSSGTLRASHVLQAMGWDDRAADQVIRVSFGWSTTREEVTRFAEALAGIVRDAHARAA